MECSFVNSHIVGHVKLLRGNTPYWEAVSDEKYEDEPALAPQTITLLGFPPSVS